jgi:sialic acid synthase SpsE
MVKRFRCPVGLSDHSLGTGVSVASVSLGAVMIEKHFTLSRRKKTPDSFFSLEPKELRSLVDDIRLVEQALGEARYGLTKKEKGSLVFRRSLFAVEDIKKGELFTEENIRSIRPASGLKPKYMKKVIGRKAARDIKRGTPLNYNLFDSK